MPEEKEVIIQPPVAIREGYMGLLDPVCFVHNVQIHLDPKHPRNPTLIITEKSHDLDEFSRRMSILLEGPENAVNAFLRDLSTIDQL